MPWRGEQSFEDLLRKEGWKTPTHDDLIFLGIDQQSLQLDATIGKEEIAGNRAFELMTERPFPWSREVWALLLDRLFGPARAWSCLTWFSITRMTGTRPFGRPWIAIAIGHHRNECGYAGYGGDAKTGRN